MHSKNFTGGKNSIISFATMREIENLPEAGTANALMRLAKVIAHHNRGYQAGEYRNSTIERARQLLEVD